MIFLPSLVLTDKARITKEGTAPLITADGRAICTTTECVVAGITLLIQLFTPSLLTQGYRLLILEFRIT